MVATLPGVASGNILSVETTGSDEEEAVEWEHGQGEVAADKEWTIALNAPVEPDAVSHETIFVLNGANERVEGINVLLGPDGDTIIVSAPDQGYQPGDTYRLFISRELRSSTGRTLNKSIMMTFVTSQ